MKIAKEEDDINIDDLLENLEQPINYENDENEYFKFEEKD